MNTSVIEGLSLDKNEKEALLGAASVRLCQLANEDVSTLPGRLAGLLEFIEDLEQHAEEQQKAARALRASVYGITGEQLDADGAFLAELLHDAEPPIASDVHAAAESGNEVEAARARRLLAAHRALLDRVREAVA